MEVKSLEFLSDDDGVHESGEEEVGCCRESA